MNALVVGLAVGARSWRGDLQRHCRDHVVDVIAQPVRDRRDARTGTFDVLVIDDDVSWLTGDLVADLLGRQVQIVGVFDPAESDGHGERHLDRLGIRATIPATATSDEILDAARALQPLTRWSAPEEPGPVRDARHPVLAVGGPAGSGVTEASIALAASLAPRAVLLDVDEVAPSIARRLGLSIHPHIVTAADAARNEAVDLDGFSERSVSDCFAHSAIDGPPLPFDTICGFAARHDWSLVRPDEVVHLIGALTGIGPVVARLGPVLEVAAGERGRFDLSRSIPPVADRLVVVIDASPTGLLRGVDWLADLLPLAGSRRIDLVANRAPGNRASQKQITDQLARLVGDRIATVQLVPHDRRVERAAWDGAVARSGKLRAAMRTIAATGWEATDTDASGSTTDLGVAA